MPWLNDDVALARAREFNPYDPGERRLPIPTNVEPADVEQAMRFQETDDLSSAPGLYFSGSDIGSITTTETERARRNSARNSQQTRQGPFSAQTRQGPFSAQIRQGPFSAPNIQGPFSAPETITIDNNTVNSSLSSGSRQRRPGRTVRTNRVRTYNREVRGLRQPNYGRSDDDGSSGEVQTRGQRRRRNQQRLDGEGIKVKKPIWKRVLEGAQQAGNNSKRIKLILS
jgi:hypothetical protein